MCANKSQKGLFTYGERRFRWRRGKLVEIPKEWRGQVTNGQTIRRRKWDSAKERRRTEFKGYCRMDRERQEKSEKQGFRKHKYLRKPVRSRHTEEMRAIEEYD